MECSWTVQGLFHKFYFSSPPVKGKTWLISVRHTSNLARGLAIVLRHLSRAKVGNLSLSPTRACAGSRAVINFYDLQPCLALPMAKFVLLFHFVTALGSIRWCKNGFGSTTRSTQACFLSQHRSVVSTTIESLMSYVNEHKALRASCHHQRCLLSTFE